MKIHLIHGVTAGGLAALAGVVFLTVYNEAFYVDFSLVINPSSIIGASIIGSILMSTGYFILEKIKKEKFQGVLNLLIMVLSFLSIIPVLTMTLPLEVDFPELFPGLVIPMHFFPALVFFGIAPFFKKN